MYTTRDLHSTRGATVGSNGDQDEIIKRIAGELTSFHASQTAEIIQMLPVGS